MRVYINVKDKRWNKYKIDIDKIVKKALILKNKGSEVTVTLTDDVEIRRLNKKYRNKDKPTNVLSFETSDSELLGDIFISFDTTMEESGRKEFINHTTHLIVHGVLHLQGFDHIKNSDAEIMEAKEIEILAKMGIENPYSDSIKNSDIKKSNSTLKSVLIFASLFLLGMVGALGFAPWYFWWGTAVSIGAAYYFSNGYKTGFWWGAGYGIMSFHWCLESIFANAEIAKQLWYFYPIGLVGIALGSGVIFGLPFWMTKQTGEIGWRRTVYFALAWASILWLREWLLTGFPWNPIANIALPSVAVSGLMAIFGAVGLTFVLIGSICSVAEFLKTRAKWQFLFLIPIMISFILPIREIELTKEKIRIVSQDLSMDRKFDENYAQDILSNLVRLSENSGADIVVWPETSYPYVAYSETKLPAIGTTLVAGAVYYGKGNMYNALLVADKDGSVTDRYFKHHLVPFGEYRPFGDIIMTPGQLDAGAGAVQIKNFVPAICYEVIFSDSLVPYNSKPEFILNITNDAWFGKTSGPWQHLDMARRQAIETGLPVIRANNSGVSAIIDSRGRVVVSLPMNTEGVLDGNIPISYATAYRKVGLNGIMLAIILMCVLVIRPWHKK